jgi:Coenzyme PQQ synthesis protein D (PqqD)
MMKENVTMRLRADSVAWNAVGEDVVVLDLTSSTYFSTNATGTVLWKLLASGASRAELVNALVERFGVDQETVERDVDAFLADLERAQLLTPDA